MSVKEYRRQIEGEIEQARALAKERVLVDVADDEISLASTSSAGGLRVKEDIDRVRDLVEDSSADPGLRAAALEAVTSTHGDPSHAHEAALARLSDPQEAPGIRRAALQLLKQAGFHSPSVDEWRPAYLEALRSAIQDDDLDLRGAALEVLAQEKDRYTQELLVDGLRHRDRALVPPEQALALLSHDVHAEVQEIAAAIADAPPNELAREEALHLLAADPSSSERFAGLFADAGETPKVRRLAATALSSLAPERFKAVAREVMESDAFSVAGAEESPASEGLRRHTQALLELDE